MPKKTKGKAGLEAGGELHQEPLDMSGAQGAGPRDPAKVTDGGGCPVTGGKVAAVRAESKPGPEDDIDDMDFDGRHGVRRYPPRIGR